MKCLKMLQSCGLLTSNKSSQRFVLLCIVSLFCTRVAVSQENSIGFRQVEIPAEDIGKYVRGYLPRKRQEFEDLVSPQPAESLPLISGKHHARFSDGLLTGTSVFEKNEKQSKAFLDLGDSIAITNPRWRHENSEQATLVGKSGTRLVVTNDETANAFVFDWKKRGSAFAESSFHLDLRFPLAASHEFVLELPSDLQLFSTLGIVREEPTDELGDTKTWRVNWSENKPIRFSILPNEAFRSLPSHDVHYDASYVFRPSGIRVQYELDIVPNSDMPQMDSVRISADENLKLSSAKLVESGSVTQLSWAPTGLTSYEISLSSEHSGRSFLLRLEATTDWAPDELFRLPKVRSNGRWMSEKIEWKTAPSLVIKDIQTFASDCKRISIDESRYERMEFLHGSEDASVDLKIATQESETTAEILISGILSNKTTALEVDAKIEALNGESFGVDLQLQRNGWIVEPQSIQVVDELGTSILEEPVIQSDDRIAIRFSQAVAASQPAMLRFQMRNEALGNKTSLVDFVPFQLQGVSQSSTWVHLRSTSGVDLALESAEHANWLEPESNVPPWIGSTIAKGNAIPDTLVTNEILNDSRLASHLLFGMNTQTAQTKIVRQSKPSFLSLNSSVHVFSGRNKSTLRYIWEIDPIGEEIDHVDLQFTEPLLTEDANWQPDSVTVNTSDEGRSYRISVPPTDKPFQLKLSREIDTAPFNVPLPTIDQSIAERMTVRIYSLGDVGLDIRPGPGLTATPASSSTNQAAGVDASGSETAGLLHAEYAYGASEAANLSLQVIHEPMSIQSSLMAWRCDVRSFYAEKGRPRHRADFYLQNDGAATFQMDFPPGYALDSVEVDGTKQSSPRLSNQHLLIALPTGVRYPCVAVRFVEPETTLGAIDWLKLPIQMSPLNEGLQQVQLDTPSSNVSCMQTTWQVWLPREYQTYPASTTESDSWKERLFGSFGTRAGPRWSQSIYREVMQRVVPPPDTSTLIDQTKSFLGRRDWRAMAQRKPAGEPSGLVTWGRRLKEVEKDIARSRINFKMMVDREELRRIGITPTTPLPSTRYTRARQRGTDRLVQAGLAILFNDNLATVTSASELKQLTGDQLVDRISASTSDPLIPPSRLLSIEQWEQDFESLWTPSSEALEIGFQQGGWGSSRRVIRNDDSDLKIYHLDTAIALSSSLFFIGYALGWLTSPKRRLQMILLSVAIVCALLLPQPGNNFAASFAWALSLSMIVRALTSASRRTTQAPKPRKPLDLTRAAIVMLAFSLAWTSQARGQEKTNEQASGSQDKAATTTSETANETLVYVPYIGETREKTDFIYVTPYFDEILTEVQEQRELRPDYLLCNAFYSGNWPSEADDWVLLEAEFGVSTFVSDAEVEIPVVSIPGRMNVDWNSVRVNQRPTDIDRTSRSIRLARPGDYKITLGFKAKLTQNEATSQTNFPIPSLPQSRLRLNLPRQIESAELRSPVSNVEGAASLGTLAVDLGAADRIQVHVTHNDRPIPPKIEQLVLLRFDGGTQAEVETRLRLPSEKKSVKLRVEEPLIPSFDAITYGKWDANTREFDTDILAPEQGIRFRFPLEGDLGLVRIPRIFAVDSQTTTQVAVITSPELDASLNADNVKLLDSDEFPARWGDGLGEPPDLVFQDDGVPRWLRLQHAAKEENWSSEVSYYFDASENLFNSSIQIATAGQRNLTVQRLRVPPRLLVETVESANSIGVPLRVRWHREADELVVFFLDQPSVSEEVPIDLSISGRLKLESKSTEQDFELPLIMPPSDSDTLVNLNVNIFRSGNVSVESLSAELTNQSIASRVQDSSVVGFRHLGSWSGQLIGSEDASLPVRVRNTDNTLNCINTTRLLRTASGWDMRTAISIEGDDATKADVIHLDVPGDVETWRVIELTEYAESPSGEDDAIELLTQMQGGISLSRRILTIWLPPSDQLNRTFLLSATLPTGQVPRIRVLNRRLPGVAEEYLELPVVDGTNNNAPLIWRTRGLTKIASEDDSIERYRINQEDYLAELTETEKSNQPEIPLLETTASWDDEHGEFLVMTQIDLIPSLLKQVWIALPNNARVIQLTCGDIPSRIANSNQTNDGVQKHLVRLNSAPWPQRINAIYRMKPGIKQGKYLLEAPQLFSKEEKDVSIPHRTMLWRVFSQGSPLSKSTQLVTPDEYDDLLLGAFSDLWSNSQVSLRDSETDKRTWLNAYWVKRLQMTLNRVQPRVDLEVDPRMPTMNQVMADFADLFEAQDNAEADKRLLYEDLWSESQWLSGSVDLYASTIDNQRNPLGDFPVLLLPHIGSDKQDQFTRYLMAAALVSIVFAVPRFPMTSRALDACYSYPHVAMILGGLAWWVALKPSWIGLLICLVTILIWGLTNIRARRMMLPT